MCGSWPQVACWHRSVVPFIDEITIYCFLIDVVSLIRFRVDVWAVGLAGEGEDEGEGESDGETDGEGRMVQLLAEEEQSNYWLSYFAN